MTRQISPLILQLLVLVLVLVASPVHACGYIYNDVFWGLPRDTSASIASVLSIPGMSPNSHEMSQRQTIYTPNTNDPLDSLVQLYYRHMCDEGRFLVGMGFGFGLTKVAVGTTVRATKTVVAAYIALEALQRTGVLKRAQVRRNWARQKYKWIQMSRQFPLPTMYGIRHDYQAAKLQRQIDEFMEIDKAETTGFGLGAFIGVAMNSA